VEEEWGARTCHHVSRALVLSPMFRPERNTLIDGIRAMDSYGSMRSAECRILRAPVAAVFTPMTSGRLLTINVHRLHGFLP
jgi:hypothetical protein